LLVLLNFSPKERSFRSGGKGIVLINNYPELIREHQGVRLLPWQAVVIAVAKD
jgi:hypothetical protein